MHRCVHRGDRLRLGASLGKSPGDTANELKQLGDLLKAHPGGVGYYPVSSFVHVDTGKKRTWRGT